MLRLFKRLFHVLWVCCWDPNRAGISHVWRQKSFKHLVGNVIVGSNVEARCCEGVGFPQESREVGKECRGQGSAIGKMAAIHYEELQMSDLSLAI